MTSRQLWRITRRFARGRRGRLHHAPLAVIVAGVALAAAAGSPWPFVAGAVVVAVMVLWRRG